MTVFRSTVMRLRDGARPEGYGHRLLEATETLAYELRGSP